MVEKKKISILVVDDEENYLHLIRDIIGDQGKVSLFCDGKKALHSIEKESYDLAFLDLMIPEIGGLELLAKIKEIHPDTVVIIMTGFSTVDASVNAMKTGAYDFIQKPFNISNIRLSLDRALNFVKVRHENRRLRQLKPHGPFVDIIGNSSKIRKVFEIIQKVAKTEVNVLIQGESGTGKELVAQAIHNSSHRGKEAFVPINCSAIPEALLESSLFGHRKGSFTGAYRDYPGLFNYADGGTLFLDEIGDMPLQIQAKLLRVLQTHRFRPLGGDKEEEVNIRILAATNQDLEKSMKRNLFREDLYYRLSVVVINVPPLRERESDIPQLARYFLKLYADPLHQPLIDDFAPEAMQALKNYSWPGNVRELQNVIERGVSLTDSELILLEDLPPRIFNDIRDSGGFIEGEEFGEIKNRVIEDFERKYLKNLLERCSGNLERALRESGISRRQFFRMLKKADLSLREFH